MGLNNPNSPPAEGRGARVKQPSAYARCILTGKGSVSSTADNRTLPTGVPSASIMEAPDEGTNIPQYAMSVSIPTGTEPRNKVEAWGSPNWPHWQDAMAKEVSELTTKHTWEVVDAPPGTNIVGSRWTYWLNAMQMGRSLAIRHA